MSDNGLRSFGFHTLDESSHPTFDALREERRSNAGFAFAEEVGLQNLDPETAARQHLLQALASNSLPTLEAPVVNGAPSEFKILGTESLPLTETRTVKFRQTYNKIPVYGSLITVELDAGNELLALNSALGDPSNVDPIAKISPATAEEKVRALAHPAAKAFDQTPRLSYYFDPAVNRWRLVYIFEDVRVNTRPRSNGNEEHAPLLMDYIIDAHSGDLIAELPRSANVLGETSRPSVGRLISFAPGAQEEDAVDGLGQQRSIRFMADAVGRGQLHDTHLNVRTFDFRFQDVDTVDLPGAFVRNPPSPWSPAAVSAHANAVVLAEFLRDVLRRNGIDNQGGPLVSSINCIVARESPDGRTWRNAAWVGTQMIYGQRAVQGDLRSYAVSLDVVAHEIFHGVTARSARLEYAGETGALNESYSDIFGVIVSNFSQPDIVQWNWELGEDLEGSGMPLRSLRNPEQFGQPAHMNDFRRLPLDRDHGGVHHNSGIHNKAAFLLITSRNAQGALLFTRDEIAALFYLALTQFLSRRSVFADSRRALELVARTLFRGNTIAVQEAKQRALAEAFDQVGIFAP